MRKLLTCYASAASASTVLKPSRTCAPNATKSTPTLIKESNSHDPKKRREGQQDP